MIAWIASFVLALLTAGLVALLCFLSASYPAIGLVTFILVMVGALTWGFREAIFWP